MLTELSLSNFKSWPCINNMRLAPITGLFGTNSSGKSSILQLLLMLKQTAESSDRRQVLSFGGESDYVRLGGFRDIIFRHDEKQTITTELKWKLPETLKIKDPSAKEMPTLFSGNEMTFETNVYQDAQGRLAVRRIAYSLSPSKKGGEGVGRMSTFSLEQDQNKPGEYVLNTTSPILPDFWFIRKRGRVWPIKEPPTKYYGFPDQVKAYHQNAGFLSDLELEFEQMLGRIYYLAPLREFPKRDYRWSGGEPTDVGRRGELSVDALLAGRERGRAISPGYKKKKQTIEERVAYWLRELGLIDAFSVRRIAEDSNLYEVRVAKGKGGAEVLIPDVGFGVSQVLPVLVLCYYAPEGSTLLFEQPEIHLHPSVQSGLADVFIDVAKNRRIQVIVESHSEHLLNRLQRRIAEGGDSDRGTTDDQVALYFCEAGRAGSTLTLLDVDLFGNIRNWPPDFFGDRFGEVAARQEAGLKQQVETEGGSGEE
ncbi:MAG: DUF3696 domain-containing protein [Phycisphaerae bacterium]|nr:DUF3696 domain-containing protein [Phycisphaerae bacterium]